MHWNRQPSQSVIEINDFDVETEAEKGAGLFFFICAEARERRRPDDWFGLGWAHLQPRLL